MNKEQSGGGTFKEPSVWRPDLPVQQEAEPSEATTPKTKSSAALKAELAALKSEVAECRAELAATRAEAAAIRAELAAFPKAVKAASVELSDLAALLNIIFQAAQARTAEFEASPSSEEGLERARDEEEDGPGRPSPIDQEDTQEDEDGPGRPSLPASSTAMKARRKSGPSPILLPVPQRSGGGRKP
jgi:hypothetical protein